MENAITQFNNGRHSLLVHQSNQTAPRYAAANKKLNRIVTRCAQLPFSLSVVFKKEVNL
jgi:hypothetical protein